jgi:toxin ParE1/3/4
MRLQYRAQALADIDAIHRYLEERSPSGARNVLRAIYASIELIAAHPLSYQRTDDPSIRVQVVQRYRYKIFYSVIGDAVEIIHVRYTPRALRGRASEQLPPDYAAPHPSYACFFALPERRGRGLHSSRYHLQSMIGFGA